MASEFSKRSLVPSRCPLWLRRYAGTAAEDIWEFCRRAAIVKELRTAIRLAEKCFWSSDLKLGKESDPETSDTQIVISLAIRKRSREEVLAAYRTLGEQLTRSVPWPKRRLILLSYDLSIP